MRMRRLAKLALPLLLVATVAQAEDRRLIGRYAMEAERSELMDELRELQGSLDGISVAVLAWRVESAESRLELALLGEELELIGAVNAQLPEASGLRPQSKLDPNEVDKFGNSGRLGRLGGETDKKLRAEGHSTRSTKTFTPRRGAFLPSPNGF